MTTSYPRHTGDFAGAFVRRSAIELVRTGHRVTVLAPGCPGAATFSNEDGINVHRPPVVPDTFFGPGIPERFEANPFSYPPRLLLGSLQLLVGGSRVFRTCDALLGHWLFPAGLACAALARGRPFGVVTHSAAARVALALPAAAQTCVRMVLRNAAFISATDPALAGNLAGLLGMPVHWIGPLANTQPLVSLPVPERFESRPLRVGFLGRAGPIKGLDILRQAVSVARSRGDSLQLTIAGPHRISPRSWERSVGPLTTDEALRGFFEKIDLLVLPSLFLGTRTEGMPCVLLESWAAARPVLGSRVGGARHVLPPRWSFPSGDVHALRRILSCLSREPEIVQCEATRCRARFQKLQARWDRAQGSALDALLPR